VQLGDVLYTMYLLKAVLILLWVLFSHMGVQHAVSYREKITI